MERRATATRTGLFIAGVTIGPIGDVMSLVGPALMVAGARLKPVEVRGPVVSFAAWAAFQ